MVISLIWKFSFDLSIKQDLQFHLIICGHEIVVLTLHIVLFYLDARLLLLFPHYPMFHILELLSFVKSLNLICPGTICQLKNGTTTTFQLTRLTTNQTCSLICWSSSSIIIEVLAQNKCSEIPPKDSLLKSIFFGSIWHQYGTWKPARCDVEAMRL